MQPIRHRKALLDSFKKSLEVEIKLDVAKAIRHHPHLTGKKSQEAYEKLASDESVERIIRDLAREEAEAAIEGGNVPAAAIIHLAGYRQNLIAEG